MKADPMTRKWKLVPVEPDAAMAKACREDPVVEYNKTDAGYIRYALALAVYSAMLSASPSPGEDVVEAALKQECWDRTGLCRCDINSHMCCTKELQLVRAVLKALEG